MYFGLLFPSTGLDYVSLFALTDGKAGPMELQTFQAATDKTISRGFSYLENALVDMKAL